MTLAFLLFFALLLSGGSGQLVQMDSDMWGYVGSQVELRCSFINSNPPVKISQVTWQRVLNGTKQNVAIANPTLGVSVLPSFRDRLRFKSPAVRQRTPSLEDTTIVLNNLRLTDEATYICEYTTFPAGNRESMVNLTVYARPMVRTTLSKPIIVVGSKAQKMTVATCISANGKPASVITWESELNGEGDTKEVLNADGTITVRSDYMVVPSRATHQQQLTCVSTYNNDQYTDSVTLNVQYEPEVIIEGFDGNWYLNRENVQLTCLADANPAVSFFQWKYLNGSMPKDAELREDSLIFKGAVGYELAGTYVCDATNSVGTGSASVEVTVTEFPSLSHGVSQEQQRAGAAIAGAVVCAMVLLAAVTLLAVFFNHQRHTFKGDYNTKKQVLGNGFSKAGSLPSLPSLPQSLSYPLGDEKKSEPYGGLRLDERIQEFHMYPEHGMKAYSTVEENKAFRYENPVADGEARVMGILGWLVALGVILSILGIAFLVRKQQQNKQREADSDSNNSSPACPKPSSNQKPVDDFQSHRKLYDEIPNTADHLACSKDERTPQRSPPVRRPLTFLPQIPYAQPNADGVTVTYSTPPNTTHAVPQEQYL